MWLGKANILPPQKSKESGEDLRYWTSVIGQLLETPHLLDSGITPKICYTLWIFSPQKQTMKCLPAYRGSYQCKVCFCTHNNWQTCSIRPFDFLWLLALKLNDDTLCKKKKKKKEILKSANALLMNFIINPIMLIKSIQCEYLAELIKVWGFLFPYLHEIRKTEKIQELKGAEQKSWMTKREDNQKTNLE